MVEQVCPVCGCAIADEGFWKEQCTAVKPAPQGKGNANVVATRLLKSKNKNIRRYKKWLK